MNNNNESAFPSKEHLTPARHGMTLRDYFAARAMQVLVSERCYPVDSSVGRESYAVADLMLKARES